MSKHVSFETYFSSTVFAYYTLWKDSVFDKLTGLNFKTGSMNWYSGLFNIQCSFLPVGVCWNIRLSKGTALAKSHDSTFGSVAAQSAIHFSLKCLTKPAGSYKFAKLHFVSSQSFYKKMKFSRRCSGLKRLYDRHVFHKYVNTNPSQSKLYTTVYRLLR